MNRLLEIWGSTRGIAQHLDVPYPTVSSWVRRGIPGRRYVEIVKAARFDGHEVTLEQLAAPMRSEAA